MDNASSKRLLDGVDAWASFYRENPHRFAADYLQLHLRLFQQIIICLMNISDFFCYIAARGQGKSFIIAVFGVIRCILYPGTKMCIASGTRAQASQILEKIKIELMPMSRLLTNEIESITLNPTVCSCIFKNGSYIKVVTASDTARSNRANILLVDEFRMVNKDIIDTVLKRFLTVSREPGYMRKQKYSKIVERNKEIYLSSAYYKSHWSYIKVVDYAKRMLDDRRHYFMCGLPYQLSIKERLLDYDAVLDEMTEAGFNEIKFETEMCCLWFGDADGNFFNYDNIAKNRKIDYPMLPDELSVLLNKDKKISIPAKRPDEKRLLSVDLAFMSSNSKKTNDASAIFIDQLLPTKTGRYTNNIVYTESSEGQNTADQALRIRKLYDMYACDYIVIDGRGAGIGVLDTLVRDISDPDTGEIYPALSSCNNSDWAARCTDKNAPKALWVVNGYDRFNSECAILLRDGFSAGRIRILNSEYEGDKLLAEIKGWGSLSTEDQLRMELPYINTTLLINELINLKHEESNGLIKIIERGDMRKDRYSSLSYAYYVACQLESKIRNSKLTDFSPKGDVFYFRAPKNNTERAVINDRRYKQEDTGRYW